MSRIQSTLKTTRQHLHLIYDHVCAIFPQGEKELILKASLTSVGEQHQTDSLGYNQFMIRHLKRLFSRLCSSVY